ncbi:MAG: hypothetical protein AAF587_06785 [Bacteroidota bacterium]
MTFEEAKTYTKQRILGHKNPQLEAIIRQDPILSSMIAGMELMYAEQLKKGESLDVSAYIRTPIAVTSDIRPARKKNRWLWMIKQVFEAYMSSEPIPLV